MSHETKTETFFTYGIKNYGSMKRANLCIKLEDILLLG